MDSGASVAMVNDKLVLTNCEPANVVISTGNKDAPIRANISGKLELRPVNNDDRLTIDNALYCPQLPVNLLSVASLDKKRLRVTFEGGMCMVLKKNRVIATGEFDASGLYRMHLKPVATNPFVQGGVETQLVFNYGVSDARPTKVTRKRTHRQCGGSCESRAPSRMIQDIGTDVVGPFPADRHGHRYFVSFRCLHTKLIAAFPMKAKSDILPHFISFVEMATRSNPDLTMDDVEVVRLDGGKEYVEFNNFCEDLGISLMTSGRDNPDGSRVERQNRSIMEIVRSVLYSSDLPVQFC
ncbi:unnamed protein product [Heterosigma akashiwo]